MKKLMFGMVAAAAMVAGADVESSNIVGYLDQEMTYSMGYNFIIPTFTDVNSATATYNLDNVQVVNGDGSGMTEAIIGYTSDATLSGDEYYWNTAADTFAGPEEDCWVNGVMGDQKVTSVTLPLGTGLYLYLGTEGASVRYAGQVCQDNVTTDLTLGYNMVGNATPVALDLNAIKLTGADGSGMTEAIIGYTSDATLSGDEYYWNTAADTFAGPEEDCWVNGVMGDEKVTGVTIQPGQGFFLYIGTEGAKMVLPAAIKK